MGYGNLQSISLTDWEAGLGTWTVGTHDRRIKSLFAKNPEYCNSRSGLLMPLIAAKYESGLLAPIKH
jgi:hypothetical protein